MARNAYKKGILQRIATEKFFDRAKPNDEPTPPYPSIDPGNTKTTKGKKTKSRRKQNSERGSAITSNSTEAFDMPDLRRTGWIAGGRIGLSGEADREIPAYNLLVPSSSLSQPPPSYDPNDPQVFAVPTLYPNITSHPDPCELLFASPPLDFVADITVYSPCPVLAASWRELKVSKYEAEQFARELIKRIPRIKEWVFENADAEGEGRRMDTADVVAEMMEVMAEVWREELKERTGTARRRKTGAGGEGESGRQNKSGDGGEEEGGGEPDSIDVPLHPWQWYEDLRLELCARRYRRALVAASMRTEREKKKCGHGRQQGHGGTKEERVGELSLDQRGWKRVAELEWRLRRDFPPVREVVSWVVEWERENVE